jgi:hypothetical protein
MFSTQFLFFAVPNDAAGETEELLILSGNKPRFRQKTHEVNVKKIGSISSCFMNPKDIIGKCTSQRNLFLAKKIHL